MQRRTLLRQIYLPFVLVTLTSILVAAWYAADSMRRFYLDQEGAGLIARARIIDFEMRGRWDEPVAEIDGLCKLLGERSSTRVTFILPTGDVLGDSMEDPARMDNHGARPEIREAMAGRVGSSIRRSDTVHDRLMYRAIPVYEDARLVGVVRTSVSLATLDQAMRNIYTSIAVGAMAPAGVAALLSLLILRRITKPLRVIRRGAERFTSGNLEERIPIPRLEEMDELAVSMNAMAGQIHERIQTIRRQRNERDAILSSMVEGVLAVDNEGQVISLNRAAAELLDVSVDDATGRGLDEVVHNPLLKRCVTESLERSERVEDEIVVEGTEARTLHVRATVLHDEEGRDIGAVLVLHDVTPIRRLEQARSDFVANVSHEIRTPVTSIKGYAETLLDGAMNDAEDMGRFLGIIARQANRLNALVNDILTLASMEQAGAAAEITFEEAPLIEVVASAVQTCQPKAHDKGIAIRVACEPSVEARLNPYLLEQAVMNLVDNAIKYSESGSEVLVEVREHGEAVVISVRDSGCGIATEHLPRLFERFYRVDKARSRKVGGTGLGLAIVKHIARLHGGTATVDSRPGQGSCFTLRLPRRDDSTRG